MNGDVERFNRLSNVLVCVHVMVSTSLVKIAALCMCSSSSRDIFSIVSVY